MPFGFHLRCEVTKECWFVGAGWDFDSYEEGQYYKSLFRHLGWKHWVSIRELLAMTELAVQILEPKLWDRGIEMARMVEEARQDAETLRMGSKHLNYPLEAAAEIWLRTRENLRCLAERMDEGPKREKLEAFLAQAEAKMTATLEHAQVRVLTVLAKPPDRRPASEVGVNG
jgi:hypothetical protein